MPNWCENILKVSGEDREVDRLLEAVQGKDKGGKPMLLDFTRVTPCPPELYEISCPQYSDDEKKQAAANVEKYGYPDWYHFCNAEWGTKWNLNRETELRRSCGLAGFRFLSAWTPPLPIVDKLVVRFPKLAFDLHFFEIGVGLAGRLCANGLLVQYDEGSKGFARIGRMFHENSNHWVMR